ncbi:Carotenoid 1,2-hydratase [Candidatus Nitrotoga sp. HW29]|uniref:lipocalin family protein n=1 Tax=Candidatus Nitrotoga sp. HW29 TaxID=2886963 RepID=UPI001EF1AE32|nr:lipocalin family protein [Candidatus Nitrotoga sp. HW29]CAH1904192.1 Carotenoid 1,2-hydratase [Candidatus Nitrotoga sp. HW29]
MRTIWQKLPWLIVLILMLIVWKYPPLLPWILAVMATFMYWLNLKRGLIGPVTLPADDAFLPTEQVQWWYWTGHLETEDGQRFGFEVVFFSFDVSWFMRDQLVQAAITDVNGNRFQFNEFVEFHLPNKTPNGFNLSVDADKSVTAVGGNGTDHLHSAIGDYVLDIDLQSTKPPALHYGGDAHPYVFGGYTYYYSRTNMATTGTLSIKGKTHKVTGTSWFDRQYGELFQAINKGWQWFAIELADNRQIMLFNFNGEEATVEKSGSITDAQGRTTTLAGHQFDVTILDHWTSPITGCTYPAGWTVTIGSEIFTVQPVVPDQELRGNHSFWVGPVYWEGACNISGAVSGQAYVELNGYCKCPKSGYRVNL